MSDSTPNLKKRINSEKYWNRKTTYQEYFSILDVGANSFIRHIEN